MSTPSIQQDNHRPSPPPLLPPPPSTLTATARFQQTAVTCAQTYTHRVDALTLKANELERRVKEVCRFYEGKERVSNLKGRSTEIGDCSKRMQEVMRQFGTVMKQILQLHQNWAWPFMKPVDVEDLGLHDYYEVVKKPMDFSTIRNQMDANKYKNAREIYADVRLIFSNAMAYNDEKSDVHVMAKNLLTKFEERWLQLLPKVREAEERLKEEEARALFNMRISQELDIAKVARDTVNELNNLSFRLDELKQLVVQRCRKTSIEEKRKLGIGISALSAENFAKVMEIISETNPDFPSTAGAGGHLVLDMDAQSEVTLLRLKLFVKDALELQAKNEASKADGDTTLRKRVIYDALARTAKKRIKKNP